jgi:hypothetical protein
VATHMMHMPSHNKITKKETVICEKINLDGWNPNPIHFITYPITFHQSKHLHPSKQTINNPNRKTCKKGRDKIWRKRKGI